MAIAAALDIFKRGIMKEFIINSNDAGQRLDKFITKACPNLPKSALYKGIRTKNIKRNGKRCEISDRLCEGDVIRLYLNDEFFTTETSPLDFLKVPSDIDIVYEDENILLVDKKCGIVVHEDDSNTVDTLINRILHYLYKKGDYKPDKEASFTPALCNRLDRNTGGIVICAKNAESLRILNQKVKDRELTKEYLCLIIGCPEKKSDTMKAYLEKDEKTNTVYVSDKKTPKNKTIITKYDVLKTNGRLSLVNVDLITGRTHQIRAHFAYIGHPLLGDGKYGINRVNRDYNIKTQALYSYRLRFDFKTESGCLSYLNNKSFEVKDVWFAEKFM